jgi:acetyl-CoA C-acetyltransferase
VLTSATFADAHGLRPRARVVWCATSGSEPVIMLTAPSETARICLAKAGMSVSDIDLWEINEAFAAVPLKVSRDLGLDPAVVNVNGGAIALGHPIGATGVMLVQTVLGMGTATVIERV